MSAQGTKHRYSNRDADIEILEEREYATKFRWDRVDIIRLHTCPACAADGKTVRLGDPRYEDGVEALDRHLANDHGPDDFPVRR